MVIDIKDRGTGLEMKSFICPGSGEYITLLTVLIRRLCLRVGDFLMYFCSLAAVKASFLQHFLPV